VLKKLLLGSKLNECELELLEVVFCVVEVQIHAPVFSRDVRNLQQRQRPMSMQSETPMDKSHLILPIGICKYTPGLRRAAFQSVEGPAHLGAPPLDLQPTACSKPDVRYFILDNIPRIK
jgi:hypothetical protein